MAAKNSTKPTPLEKFVQAQIDAYFGQPGFLTSAKLVSCSTATNLTKFIARRVAEECRDRLVKRAVSLNSIAYGSGTLELASHELQKGAEEIAKEFEL